MYLLIYDYDHFLYVYRKWSFCVKGGMLMHNHQRELHVVSTNQQSAERLIQTIVLIHPYVDAIHIREKRWTARKISKVVKYLYQESVPREKIIINDRVDVEIGRASCRERV